MSDKPSLLQEFREFAVKGNVIDLAVGVIIGAAFGKIVTSLVNDMIMPLFSPIVGKINFESLFIPLDGKQYATVEAAKAAKVATLNYGVFLSNVIDFLLVAVVIFAMVKGINRFRRQEAAAPAIPPAPTREEELLTEIRDALLARPAA